MSRVKKIALVQPNMKWINWNWKTSWDIHPMNLCLLGAMIRKDYDVTIVDGNSQDYTPEQFKKIIQDLKPDLVGLTLLTNEYWESAHLGAKYVKEIDPNIITVIGGVYATVSYKTIHKDTNFDYICVGEGEYVFPELLQYLNGAADFPKNGFLGRKNGEAADPNKLQRAPFIQNLDVLPYPAWDMVDYAAYTNMVGKVTVDHPYLYPYTRMMTSRGCPIGCSFCEVELITGGPFRYRSVDNVIKELEWLKKDYGIKSFMLDDDNFFINRNRTKEFCKTLIDKKMNLSWKAHAVAVFHMNDEIIDLMADSGCCSVALAVESGTERVLKDIIHKPVKLDAARKVSKKIKERGMDLINNFIIGFPTETWAEIRQTFAFAEELDPDYAKFFIATPLEGTDLAKMAMENNLIATHADTTGQMKDMNWSTSQILSNEWTVEDITIMRAYEWERINFRTAKKREKMAQMMGITLDELEALRKNTFASVLANLDKIREMKKGGNGHKTVEVEHHGDHRSPGAQTYPGVEMTREKASAPVSFGF